MKTDLQPNPLVTDATVFFKVIKESMIVSGYTLIDSSCNVTPLVEGTEIVFRMLVKRWA